jgi:hypothetical protein
MTRAVADAALPAKLRETIETVEVCDEFGQLLGYYQPAAHAKSPFTRDEIERRRKEVGGFSRQEILNDLQAS